ncbi:MAG: hypothetical protein QM730_11005 [Anaerolineales bacterium]
MKRTIQLFLLLSVFMLSTGCKAQTSSTNPAPAIDHLIVFNEDGYAVVRGKVAGDWSCSTINGKLRATLNVDVPVLVDGIEASVDLLFMLSFETELSSNLTPYTTVRDYLAANPNSTTFDAFPIFETVDVTFIKKDTSFEVISIHQVADPSSARIAIDGMVTTNIFSRGILEGTIAGANWSDDLVTWTLSIPVTVQGIPASVRIPILSNIKTKVIANGSSVPMDIYHPIGHVQVEFARTENQLEAIRFTELP